MTTPIPPHIWSRLVQFLAPGHHGRIEIDVVDGRIVNVRIIESIRVSERDTVELREVR